MTGDWRCRRLVKAITELSVREIREWSEAVSQADIWENQQGSSCSSPALVLSSHLSRSVRFAGAGKSTPTQMGFHPRDSTSYQLLDSVFLTRSAPIIFIVASHRYRPVISIPRIRFPRDMPGRANTSLPRLMSSPSSPSWSYDLTSRSGSFGGP